MLPESLLEDVFLKGNQAFLDFTISSIGFDVGVGFGFKEPVKAAEKAMEWTKAKLQSIQILNIEFGTGSLAQILFTTTTQITLLEVVCVGPVGLDLAVH